MAETTWPDKPALRARLLRHVLLPLGLTWGLGMLATLAVANYFTQQAYDRSLLDDAFGLAANVSLRDGRLVLGLSPGEMSTVLFDQSEAVFFAVYSADHSLVAGHAGLHPPDLAQDLSHEFSDTVYQGRRLRAVTVRRELPARFEVVMAQTTTSRALLLQRLLLLSVVPQALLLLGLAAWLWRGIQADLAPLNALQQAVDQRDAHDLTALPERLSGDASSRDVQHLGMAINALLARVARGIQAQREFAGNVAHELRTPLAGIRALAEHGLAQPEAAVWRQQLRAVLHSQARASHLVDQLLALALADEAGASLRLAPVALEPLVKQAVLQYLPRADALGVDLGVDFGALGSDAGVSVWGQAALLEGLVGNLLDNALRYGVAPRAGEVPRVTVAVHRWADAQGQAFVRLAVIDEGPGLSAAETVAATQRWAQGTAGERLGQGAGLGLAIVCRYAALMQAELHLGPAANGRGLEVRVDLRAASPASPASYEPPVAVGQA